MRTVLWRQRCTQWCWYVDTIRICICIRRYAIAVFGAASEPGGRPIVSIQPYYLPTPIIINSLIHKLCWDETISILDIQSFKP